MRLTLDLTGQPTYGEQATDPPPQGSGTVTRRPSTNHKNVKDFTVEVVPRLPASLPAQRPWMVRGRVKSAFTLSPRQVHFGESLMRGQPFASRIVTLTPLTALESVTASCDPKFASVKVSGKGDRYYLEIMPNDSLPSGPLRFEVIVEAAIRGGRESARLAAQVAGTVMQDLQTVPAAVAFGAVPVGRTVTETLVLRSVNGTEFEVKAIDFSSSDITVASTAKPFDNGQTFRLTQRVSQRGNQSSTVTFLLRTPDGETSTVSVQITYFGIVDD